jgi:uncharacterized protein
VEHDVFCALCVLRQLAVRRGANRTRTWHQNYLTTLLERDVHEVANLRDASQLELLLKRLALQSGSLLHRSALGRELGMDRDIANHWLNGVRALFTRRRRGADRCLPRSL